ncbi:MAG TPA: porin [Burkholderiales bacterium]|nr:porin [Burkholderiales bacterium]
MNRRTLVVAVASVLAFPGGAFAQSSVSISGHIKMAMENVKLGNSARSPSSENRVVDESSRIIFRMVEDLGSGVQAFAQIDWRVVTDAGSDNAGGNNAIGLRSKSWGQFLFGRWDLHYNYSTTEISSKGGSYKAQNIAILAYAGGGGVAIANDSRTANLYKYDSPNWGGFTVTAAYSTNPSAPEADIGSAVRRGYAYNVAPIFTADNWQAGYSYWRAKPDAFVGDDQRGDRAWGYYTWGGLKVGLTYDRAKLTAGATGVRTSDRTAWAPTLRYATAQHNFYLEYSKAKDDKATAVSDGAYMIAAGYAYDLSKRTSIGISYVTVKNDAGAVYNVYGGGGSLASTGAPPLPGEDPRLWSLSIKHAF